MEVLVIWTNGTEETVEVGTSRAGVIDAVCSLIGAKTLDTVNLRDGRVMLLDDAGWETRSERRAATWCTSCRRAGPNR